jgi:hypothetical protein
VVCVRFHVGLSRATNLEATTTQSQPIAPHDDVAQNISVGEERVSDGAVMKMSRVSAVGVLLGMSITGGYSGFAL